MRVFVEYRNAFIVKMYATYTFIRDVRLYFNPRGGFTRDTEVYTVTIGPGMPYACFVQFQVKFENIVPAITVKTLSTL